jgi:hypothetical protein
MKDKTEPAETQAFFARGASECLAPNFPLYHIPQILSSKNS